MSYYGQREYGGQYNNYRPNQRRNSNSFSEEETGGVKRKRWSRRGRGGSGGPSGKGGGSAAVSPQSLFKEPISVPMRSPAQNRKRDNLSRNGPSPIRPQKYFDMRDMPDFVEPEHSGREWRWDNYMQNCKSWQDKHKLAYYRSRCMALEFENQMLFEQINSLIEENCIFATERGLTPTMRLPEMPGSRTEHANVAEGRSSNKKPTMKNQGKDDVERISDSSSDIEFVVPQATMDFLEKSIRHKLSLKKERGETSKKSVEDSKKQDGPKQPAGLKRKDELDLLYGKNSSLIHKLETSVQLNFNRNCDTHKPDLWMAAPLNPNTTDAVDH